ncbi:hypothetical protein EVG20_g8700 [Dentipellis fragilis]|uniref:F-box domain-containing protein n=1 Tax=Dentipellis fragilis TaxID=205917 RepID=A0A4Y9Y3H2_9AGAM|nr:hypothetical protein EVG20_g8700 [Dentipellis fragilis]
MFTFIRNWGSLPDGAVANHGVSSTETTAYTRQVIDNRVNKLWNEISSLCTQRNHLLALYKLPPELLVLIFTELIALQSRTLHCLRRNTLSPGWMAVTHVCRRWREVALQRPTLWTTISTDLGQTWMEEMLARSRSLPLTVRAHIQDDCDVFSLIAQMSRTVHLHLALDDVIELGSPCSLIVQPAPILETCSLSLLDEEDDEYFDPPHNLFAQNAPRLHSLELEVCTVHWSSLAFVSLVKLSITVPADNPWRPLSPPAYREELLQALSKMPKLENLTLDNCLPDSKNMADDGPGMPHNPNTVIQPPLLKILSLIGKPYDITAFLPSLRLLPTCKLSMTCEVEWRNGDDDMDVFGLALPNLLNFLDMPILRLGIRASASCDDYEVSLWTRTHPWADRPLFPAAADNPDPADEDALPNIRMVAALDRPAVVTPMMDIEEIPDALRFACYSLPLAHVQVLDIVDEALRWEWHTWTRLAEHMDDLQHIRASHRLDASLVASLSKQRDSKKLMAPRLRTIMIVDSPECRELKEKRAFLKAFTGAVKQRRGLAPALEGLYLRGYAPKFRQKMKHLVYMLGIERLVPVLLGGESP